MRFVAWALAFCRPDPPASRFLRAGIMFSILALGDPWADRSGTELVYAADSIVQNSKPANEASTSTVKFTGEVTKGQGFEKPIGPNLFFRLIPEELGWMIFVGGKDVENNFCAVVTPPYRGINAIQIEGWHFRNSDNSGPNEPGPKNVNAPQDLRVFYFVLNEADYRSAFDALQILLWPYSYSKQQIDAAEGAHSKLRKGRGMLQIRDLKLDTLNRKQAGIDRIAFDVELNFP